MLNTNHPHDERLSALAAHDPDETDPAVAAHVASCDRCASVVSELGALRMALSELPDLAPSRPLQLIPAVERGRADDRASGWARRFFAPLLAGGAAIALVGAVGTASPALDGATGGADSAASVAATRENFAAEPGASAAGAPAAEGALDEFGGRALGSDEESPESNSAEPRAAVGQGTQGDGSGAVTDSTSQLQASAPGERSPWPMVLFTGVAVMIGALLMRWVLVPRAG